MIPRSFSGRLAEPSPQQTERDLASLIHRTVKMAAQARHELGYAAVNIGCDGVRRVTMFDGSSCQASGDVCLATREEGITVCLEMPRGSGLVFQRVAFSAPECAPVTGWWIVDSAGFMYRVPTSLITAPADWPMSVDPTVPEPAVTLVRAGTWAKLMCGAALTVPLNATGGALWYRSGESDWGQQFACALGGTLPRWTVLPAATVTTDTQVHVAFTAGTLTLQPTGSIGLSGVTLHRYGWWLTEGTEYALTIYVSADGNISDIEGDTVPTGTATEAAIPEGAWRVGYVVIPYGLTGASFTATATADDVQYPAWVNPAAFQDIPSILLRDNVAPNAGLRVASLTLPVAESGVVTGLVRVAYGYPFAAVAESGFHTYPLDTAPWMRTYTWEPPGTWQTDCVGRVPGDMALCYRRGLAVEYANDHVCLDGADITDPNDYVGLDELDYEHGPALDVAAGVIATPGQEVVLLGTYGDLRTGRRYRVRPAPDTAPSAAYEHRAATWGDDPNPWIEEQAYYSVAEWTTPTTEFQITGGDFSDLTQHPATGVPVVLWKRDDFETLYAESTFTQYGYLGETVAGVTQILDQYGVPISLPAWPGGSVYLAVIGRELRFRYGWTFGISSGASIIESALSPLVTLEPPGGGIGSNTYSVAVTVPGGPTVTVVRYVYRFAWDYGSVATGGPWHAVGPWSYLGVPGGGEGGVYDRMCRRVKTLTASLAEPGTDPITFYDEDTSLATYGTRPPSPLVYTGPITVDAPLPVHLLQPMNL